MLRLLVASSAPFVRLGSSPCCVPLSTHVNVTQSSSSSRRFITTIPFSSSSSSSSKRKSPEAPAGFVPVTLDPSHTTTQTATNIDVNQRQLLLLLRRFSLCVQPAGRRQPHPSMYAFVEKRTPFQITLNPLLLISHLHKLKPLFQSIIFHQASILFVSTAGEKDELTKQLAMDLNQYFLVHDFVSGTFTNVTQTRKHYLAHPQFCNLPKLGRNPDFIFIANPHVHSRIVHEARQLNIPIICIADAYTDVSKFQYYIPGVARTPMQTAAFYTMIKYMYQKVAQTMFFKDFKSISSLPLPPPPPPSAMDTSQLASPLPPSRPFRRPSSSSFSRNMY
eukprot:TRINITY_DN5074_c0_g1_i1.p1 TRINITY_DN5074_c0_g1~~TRINITY_DN5074_c0_g1_i1.p1  ORF type:complete len:334 (-),score=82.30 TRINITY_DN5074_c0_g1_i1:296-1297(-)